ncbi:ABC transporter permease [Streptomyces chiangmaiensis]
MNQVTSYVESNWQQIQQWGLTTVWLAAVPVVVGLALAVPCGWIAYRYKWLEGPLVSGLSVIYTVPSVVLFLVLPDVFGTKILDPFNVMAALTIYSFVLLVRTVSGALGSVPHSVLSAAGAMGYTGRQLVLRVHLPLAVPVIAAGVRVAAVSNVSLVSVASVIGTAQLGQLFIAGNNTSSLAPIIVGLFAFMAIALVYDLVIITLTRLLTPGTGRSPHDSRGRQRPARTGPGGHLVQRPGQLVGIEWADRPHTRAPAVHGGRDSRCGPRRHPCGTGHRAHGEGHRRGCGPGEHTPGRTDTGIPDLLDRGAHPTSPSGGDGERSFRRAVSPTWSRP